MPRPQHCTLLRQSWNRSQNLVSWSQHCISIGYCTGRNEILGVSRNTAPVAPVLNIGAISFIADRTYYGRAYAIVLRLSVIRVSTSRRLYRMYC